MSATSRRTLLTSMQALWMAGLDNLFDPGFVLTQELARAERRLRRELEDAYPGHVYDRAHAHLRIVVEYFVPGEPADEAES